MRAYRVQANSLADPRVTAPRPRSLLSGADNYVTVKICPFDHTWYDAWLLWNVARREKSIRQLPFGRKQIIAASTGRHTRPCRQLELLDTEVE